MSIPFYSRRQDEAIDPIAAGFRVVYLYARLPSDIAPEDVYDDDWEAPGVYEVLVPAEFSDAFAANCALAAYNMVVPIKYLYMFEFTVRDSETGYEIEPDYSRDYYEFADRCGGVTLLGHLA